MILLRCDHCDHESKIEPLGSFGAMLPRQWETDPKNRDLHWCSTRCRRAWELARQVKRKPGDPRDVNEMCHCGHPYGEHSARGHHPCMEPKAKGRGYKTSTGTCGCAKFKPRRATKDDADVLVS